MKYKTLTNLNHDGVKYPPGAEVELSDHEAKPLLECKAVEPLNKPFAKKVVVTTNLEG